MNSENNLENFTNSKETEEWRANLKKYAKPSCKKCCGRGYVGIHLDRDIVEPYICKCFLSKKSKINLEKENINE